MYSQESLITVLSGIGPKKALLYNQLNIFTLEDLLRCFPQSYPNRGNVRDFSSAEPGEKLLCEAVFEKSGAVGYIKRGFTRKILYFTAAGTGRFKAVYYNMPFIGTGLKENETYRIYGSVALIGKEKCFVNPTIEKLSDDMYLKEGIYPFYPIGRKSGISQKEFTSSVKKAAANCVLNEDMPLKLMLKAGLKGINESVAQIHFPMNERDAAEGKTYFALEDFLAFNFMMRKPRKRAAAARLSASGLARFTSALPFSLTPAQERVLREVIADMESGVQMNRLIQGDVGSGKTAVAMAAGYIAADNCAQCAFCAPTQVLSRQHYEKYSPLFESLGVNCVYLASKMSAAERRQAEERIKEGSARIIFGTHALFSQDIEYDNLALVVIDEQQRYGVGQRLSLIEKGTAPHLIVMSATPIPRTLALSFYKNLDLSVIDTMPPGRSPISTYIINESHFEKMLEYIRDKARLGLKTYVVCPAIDAAEMENVKDTFEKIKEKLSPYRCACLSGETKPEEAQRLMDEFGSGKISVLVSTSIIEVGVDDPDAAVMWIRGAERFGLSQLHQLRGRVGRGKAESACFLQPSQGVRANERLKVIKKTTDGFEIAMEDLRLRGSGEIFGYRQSGRDDALMEYIMSYEELFKKSEEYLELLESSADEQSVKYLILTKERASKRFDKVAMN